MPTPISSGSEYFPLLKLGEENRDLFLHVVTFLNSKEEGTFNRSSKHVYKLLHPEWVDETGNVKKERPLDLQTEKQIIKALFEELKSLNPDLNILTNNQHLKLLYPLYHFVTTIPHETYQSFFLTPLQLFFYCEFNGSLEYFIQLKSIHPLYKKGLPRESEILKLFDEEKKEISPQELLNCLGFSSEEPQTEQILDEIRFKIAYLRSHLFPQEIDSFLELCKTNQTGKVFNQNYLTSLFKLDKEATNPYYEPSCSKNREPSPSPQIIDYFGHPESILALLKEKNPSTQFTPEEKFLMILNTLARLRKKIANPLFEAQLAEAFLPITTKIDELIKNCQNKII